MRSCALLPLSSFRCRILQVTIGGGHVDCVMCPLKQAVGTVAGHGGNIECGLD